MDAGTFTVAAFCKPPLRLPQDLTLTASRGAFYRKRRPPAQPPEAARAAHPLVRSSARPPVRLPHAEALGAQGAMVTHGSL
jgi:hypothetical protein